MAVHNMRRVACAATAVAVTMAAAASTVFASNRSTRAADVAARVMTARAAAAGSVAGKVLGGFTSQGWPVVVVISSNGKRIVDTRIGLDMTCSMGDNFGLRDGWVQLPIARSGKVKVSFGIAPWSSGTIKLLGGSDSLTGKLNRKRWTFAGTWKLHLTFQDTSTGQVDQCDSGQVSFNAIL
jgi:hypothetical protein